MSERAHDDVGLKADLREAVTPNYTAALMVDPARRDVRPEPNPSPSRTTSRDPSRAALADRVLIVTGASSGIGAATAIAAATAGMDVVLNARRIERLARVAELVEAHGRGAEIVVGDVAEPGLSARMLDAAEARFGRFDAVFANAGYGMERPVVEVPMAELRAIFETNFFASLELVQLAAQRLIDADRRGHLLMCSSCLAKFTLPGFSAYSATKAAQSHVCRAMRFELAPYGIEVSSVHPITTVTEFFDQAAQRSGLEPPATGVHDHVPRWMIQTPERVAAAVIDCLRRPRSEVWTSHLVRLSAGLFTAFPWVQDMVMRREARRLREKSGTGTNSGGASPG